MNRPNVPLRNHLLTRADLAEMAVPATEVFRWLAEGWLEQVGALPRTDRSEDPVFSVGDDALRLRLSGSLAGIGKDTVVMTPLGVRSFLLRALMLGRDGDAQQAQAGSTGSTAVVERHPAIVTMEEVSSTDVVLSEVLHHAAQGLCEDVDAMLRLASEIAAEEALATGPTAAPTTQDTTVDELPFEAAGDGDHVAAAPTDGSESEAPEFDGFGGEAEPMPEDECFDFDDLAEQLDEWHDEPSEQPPTEEQDGGNDPADVPTDAHEPTEDLDMNPKQGEAAPEAAEERAGTLTGEEHDVMQELFASPDEPAPSDDADAVAEDVSPSPAQTEPVEATPAEGTAAEAVRDIDEPQPPVDSADASQAVEPEASATEHEQEPDAQLDDDSVAAHARAEIEVATEHDAPVIGSASENSEPERDVAPPPPPPDEFALTSAAMDRVQDFLGELRSALVEMVRQPPSAPAVDVTPLVSALQTGLERSNEHAQQTQAALSSLSQQLGQFGEHVENGMQRSMTAMIERMPKAMAPAANPAILPPPAGFVARSGDTQSIVMAAVAVLVVCWAILFWFKTGSPRLALATLIGANAIGCCLLLARNRGS